MRSASELCGQALLWQALRSESHYFLEFGHGDLAIPSIFYCPGDNAQEETSTARPALAAERLRTHTTQSAIQIFVVPFPVQA
jgi:hypothetical protein